MGENPWYSTIDYRCLAPLFIREHDNDSDLIIREMWSLILIIIIII